MFAHIAGLPVEEMLPLVYGVSGVGVFAHLAVRRRASRRRQPPSAPPTHRDRGKRSSP
ncbi:MAG TPA: hypothetical protein VK480_10210 [Solirubrobacterales bacterium]|nr:hypothetical protein [Solirubrobacterales bacterium]